MAAEKEMSPEEDAAKRDALKQLLDAGDAEDAADAPAAAEGAEMAQEGAMEEQEGKVEEAEATEGVDLAPLENLPICAVASDGRNCQRGEGVGESIGVGVGIRAASCGRSAHSRFQEHSHRVIGEGHRHRATGSCSGFVVTPRGCSGPAVQIWYWLLL